MLPCSEGAWPPFRCSSSSSPTQVRQELVNKELLLSTHMFCQHTVVGALGHGSKRRDMIDPLHLELRKVSSNWTCCWPANTAHISSPVVSCIICFFQSHFHKDLRRLVRQNRHFVPAALCPQPLISCVFVRNMKQRKDELSATWLTKGCLVFNFAACIRLCNPCILLLEPHKVLSQLFLVAFLTFQ